MLMHIWQHLKISIGCSMCGKGFQNVASLCKHRKKFILFTSWRQKMNMGIYHMILFMIPRDIPEGSWQDLAADFFHYNNTKYILITDTFSKYPFLYKVSSKAAEPVTKISQYGPPKAFSQFLSKEHIELITSSPLYPRSNGFIECQIKTIKQHFPHAKNQNNL